MRAAAAALMLAALVATPAVSLVRSTERSERLCGFDSTSDENYRRPYLERGAARAACLAARAAAALVAADRVPEAETAFAEAARQAPDDDSRKLVADTAAQAFDQRGHDLFNLQDWPASAASFALALKYDPHDIKALVGRGNAHVGAAEPDAAIADYGAALGIDAAAPDTYVLRGNAFEMKLDFDGAIADFSKSIELNPEPNNALGFRGRLYAAQGRYEDARRDLERWLIQNPADIISVVWLHIVHMRQGEKDSEWLRGQAATLNLKQWPGPAIAYFLGTETADQMVQFAQTSAETMAAYQKCDGWFYLAEEAVAHGDREKARALFRRTIESCNAVDYEWDTAQIELRRLGP